jgi:hypothetical protein
MDWIERIADGVERVIERHRHHGPPTGLVIRATYHTHRYFNAEGEEIMSTTPAGGTSVFQVVPTPPGTALPPSTKYNWTSDDTGDVTLSATQDGDPTKIQVTCVPKPVGTSYNLTCTTDFTPPGAPGPLTVTLNVPIIPGAQNPPTGLQINQLS